MALDKQIHLHSVDTSAFYNEQEQDIENQINNCYSKIRELKSHKTKNEPNEVIGENVDTQLQTIEKEIKKLRKDLKQIIPRNDKIRILNPNEIRVENMVSSFESTLTRTLGVKTNEVTLDLIIVRAYYYDILEDLIVDGFLYNDEKYVCLTASAGQIRTKKTVFIKEAVLGKHLPSLMCGLTVEDINKMGGININKYLAYLALCNSATDEWKEFDIRKTIVVNDMETVVRGLVDFIDENTFEITRKEMDVLINHTDGCGMVLPRVSKKNFMIRLPWVKGLLISFPFDKFLEKFNSQTQGTQYGMVTDIFGKKHDVLKDGIEIIFTKSQFKMYKYYKDWQQYIDNFIEYNCQAGICNIEEDGFDNAKLNYQMLQTLSDMTDEELFEITKMTRDTISKVDNDRRTVFKILGVTKYNNRKTDFQKAIELYPELIYDKYSRNIIRETKQSLVKEALSAKLEIDGKYTFISPDLYAFCENLFLGIKNPKGLLHDGEVFCKFYKDKPKLDCLRAPHLFLEHCVRNNVLDDDKHEWFTTNALYVSCHDLISKILMFDVDGDKSLVCADKTIIDAAERNSKGIVPLNYNMATSGSKVLTHSTIFDGLKNAYSGGNIGVISNDITKIWNSENISIDAIKVLCCFNNHIIDYAKTLYKPKLPKQVKDLISHYTKSKVPHFFIYAKNKKPNQVENINNSVVNRLINFIPNKNIKFKNMGMGRFLYRNLLNIQEFRYDQDIIDKYDELNKKKHFLLKKNEGYDEDESQYQNLDAVGLYIRNKLLEVNQDIYYVVDVLIHELYGSRRASVKRTLWESFGDIIVENLKKNIETKYTYCEVCGDLIEQTIDNIKYCRKCWKTINREQIRQRVKKYRKCNGATKHTQTT